MQHIAKFLLLVALFFSVVALSASVTLDPRQMPVEYGLGYEDKDCGVAERKMYGHNNYIKIDALEIIRGIKGFRPLTIYSDASCTQSAKYYRKGSCAHYDNTFFTIRCVHMD